tara:strand:- start:8 stop:1255 length:1248 start_codon:yes stop_codon:yes gene_type:complete
MDKKIKVLVIADHPLSPSGVGTQTKYMIEALLKTGKFSFRCLGGAVKHENYQPVKVDPYGDDFVVFPVDGYGTQEIVRSVIWNEKPDILWFMTDPRFFPWLWEMENEIRKNVPMVYYHVWDNYPAPHFNRQFYLSNDVIVSISKLTNNIVKEVAPEVELHHIPHAVNEQFFYQLPKEEIEQFKKEHNMGNEFVFFWNNRNARRKLSGTVLWWFDEFAKQVGEDKVKLIMHTDPRDSHGQDLPQLINKLNSKSILLSSQKLPPEHLAKLYNVAECTINISDAEGFGLATLESLSCGTPIIVNMTGGLQEQVTDGENWFGIGIEPASKVVIGSQTVPYINEDRVGKEDFLNALHKIYKMSKKERNKLAKLGKEHIKTNYNFSDFEKNWTDLMINVHKEHGSWANRKQYSAWDCLEMK